MRLTRQMAQIYTPAQTTSMVLGVILSLVGIIGFFQDPILGLFAVDALHNILHLGTGVIALIVAFGEETSARMFLQIMGIVYAVITIIGLIQGTTVLWIMETNGADNALHAILALVMLGVGYYPEMSEKV